MGKTRHHGAGIRSVFAALLGLSAAVLLAGCGKKSKEPGTPVLNTISLEKDSMQVETEEGKSTVETGIASILPEFSTSTGVQTEEMTKLNEILESIEKDYEVDLSSDRKLMMLHTDTASSDAYLQTTVYQTEFVTTLTGRVRRIRNLCSLAYRISDNTPITAVEALDSTGMTGVLLSQKVSDAFAAMGIDGSLHSTNMQGFLLDAEGKVEKIYMKLEIDTGEEDCAEAFTVFDPSTMTMTALSWPEDLTSAEFDPAALQSKEK